MPEFLLELPMLLVEHFILHHLLEFIEHYVRRLFLK